MKRKLLVSSLALLVSIGVATIANAASSNVTVQPSGIQFTGAVQGENQYGRVTLISEGGASAFIYRNCDGTWKQTTIRDDGKGNLAVSETGGTDTNNYYMSSTCQYKMEVFAHKKQAKGYITTKD